MKVGFVDINQNVFKLREEIDKLLRDRWLDLDTIKHFEEQAYKRRDALSLTNLITDIKAEIVHRKKKWGYEGHRA